MIKIKVSDLLGKHKMSQAELSRLTGIRPGTINALYYETVKRISIDQIDRLCKVLNCQPGDIFEYIPD